MKLAFTKMQGTGNDFVLIDATARRFEADPRLLAQLTDRRYGVGCDQVLVVEAPSAPDVDFDYRIFNADGSEAGQCGNGARALARFVRARGLSRADELSVRTSTTRLRLRLRPDGQVTVDMGVPRLEPKDIPLALGERTPRYSAVLDDGAVVEFGAVSMGNPHAVIRVENVANAPVAELGARLQRHALFPESVNVGFLQVIRRAAVSLRVFERGSGETESCGTGACAAVVVGRLWELLDDSVEVRVRGGTLRVEWPGEGEPVQMTGPAEFVFNGEIEWPT